MTMIDAADPVRGVPDEAHCERCGTEWCRPTDDEHAETLVAFARLHRILHTAPVAP